MKGHVIPKILLFIVVCSIMGFTTESRAEIKHWVVGGQIPWAEFGSLKALDNTTSPGAIQPREFNPNENIILTLGRHHYYMIPIYNPFFKKGEDMRFWSGRKGSGEHEKSMVDGNPSTFTDFRKGSSHWITLDTGLPVFANRLVFYPPQEGKNPKTGKLYKEEYMKSFELSTCLNEPDFFAEERLPGGRYHRLEHTLARVIHNFDSIVEVSFPLQIVRFLRLAFIGITTEPFVIAEIELYGEGFAPKAVYRSKVIDLGQPVNFGKIECVVTKWRQERIWKRVEGRWEIVGGDLSPVPAPDASVSVAVKTKSGSDDTPLVYHKIGAALDEEEVTKDEYEKLYPRSYGAPVLPGQRGSVTRDVENWSILSAPVGGRITSPGPRRWFQFEIIIESECPWEYARIESLWFEYSPPLAKQVLGEVAVLNDPSPLEGTAEAVAGEPTTFTYDIRAEFDSLDQPGFDALRIAVPRQTVFKELKIGNPLKSVAPRDVVIGPDNLAIYLQDKITPDRNEPIRVIFTTQISNYISRFTGKVFNTRGDYLSQQITPGNANDEVSTDKLTVLASGVSFEKVLKSLNVSPRCITPNGDGRNDKTVISYIILQVKKAQVNISIYNISGAEIRKLSSQEETAGLHSKEWDGRADGGELVPPGLYICKVSVSTDAGISQMSRTCVIVY